MPRPRPPYLSHERNFRGTPVWYVRVNGKRIRIRETYGTPEFDTAYQAALARVRKEPDGPGRGAAGSLHFLDTMRGLFRWAYKAQLIKHDPTAGVESPTRPRGGGFTPWTEDDVAAYEQRWPIGTRQRVWLGVLLYTGLRRGDAVRLGRPHIRNGVAHIKTEKTDTPVALPILPILAQTLAAGPCGDLTFIAGAKGRPLTKESFGNEFRDACRAAGIDKSAHGLRKIAAIRCAQNGATVPQMNAIFGWSGAKMALHYIEFANREKMAADAMHLMNETAIRKGK